MTSIEELSNQLVPIIVIVGFAWYISHFAKATIPRLLFFSFGAYFTIAGTTDFDRLIGIGLVLPHLKFFFEWITDIFDSFRRGTLDLYYSFLTIYYKTRNVFIKAYRFFSGKKSSQKKSTGSDYYQKQEYRQYEDFGQSSQNQNRKKQRQEQDSYSDYEEPKQEQYYEKEKIEDEIPSEYKRFFSSNYYKVLGVSPDEDFASIKKKFRKLQRQYHPDLNIDETELFTKISQNLNQAYEYFQKIYKV